MRREVRTASHPHHPSPLSPPGELSALWRKLRGFRLLAVVVTLDE
jgi:hypothetical protein